MVSPSRSFYPSSLLPSPFSIQSLDPAACQEEVSRLCKAAALLPFAWTRGLYCGSKFKIRPDQHIVLTNIHHIIMDGWSMGVLLHELSALYAAFRAGRPSPLREPVVIRRFCRLAAEWHARRAFRFSPGLLENQRCDFPQPPERTASQLLPQPRPIMEAVPLCFAGAPGDRVKGFQPAPGRHILHDPAGLHVRSSSTIITGGRLFVNAPIANRSLAELEGLIGSFIKMSSDLHNLSENPVFGDFSEPG